MASFSFPQFEHEPFWRYFERLEESLGSDYRFDLWELCEVFYDGLNELTRGMVENMFHGGFRAKSLDEAWNFYNWLARDTYDWEMTNHGTCVRDFHVSNVDSSFCMNSLEMSHAFNSEPNMHDSNPGFPLFSC